MRSNSDNDLCSLSITAAQEDKKSKADQSSSLQPIASNQESDRAGEHDAGLHDVKEADSLQSTKGHDIKEVDLVASQKGRIIDGSHERSTNHPDVVAPHLKHSWFDPRTETWKPIPTKRQV
eukprot:gnl/MRDRNA2_/MRDRNA2_230986_c0_seq1.p1 gnl/MRDRNA2_/MRDRNA2_230986_c0~~gnl/MRDRNA2_/MRDRNA2_230986_c0_seq1.p1  ORF type:complete len:121 (+),score=20.55 gnl/MRDRNA2_/MRDRNA2_230986_c0_seq1:112-474(+)